jgi:hypothetical protein
MIPYYDKDEYINIRGKRYYVIHPNKNKKRKKKLNINPYRINPVKTI